MKERHCRPAIAGPMGFYPTDKKKLEASIKEYLNQAEKLVADAPFGLIAPHAGYDYSGPVAGWAYRQIMDYEYRSVIVLAPSHSSYIPFVSIMASQ